MKLFTNIFDTRDCIRLYQYIRIIENIYYFKKIRKSSLIDIDNIKYRVNNNISTYNSTYKSLHYIENYNKIKDLLIDIFVNVNKNNSDLHISDLFVKKWTNIESNLNFGLNTGKDYDLFTMNNSAVQSINYIFHNYIAITFTEDCQIFYDNIDSYNFDKSVICPRGSVLFLENEHFVVKNLALFYSIGMGFSKTHSVINDIINTDNIKNERYLDLEIA